jgi:hypothetical protein
MYANFAKVFVEAIPMQWNSKFPRPLVLKDGREISSHMPARDVIVLIPIDQLRNAHWEYATDLIYGAAGNGDEVVIGLAFMSSFFERQFVL